MFVLYVNVGLTISPHPPFKMLIIRCLPTNLFNDLRDLRITIRQV